MIDVLTEICNKIWRTGIWPTPWPQSLIENILDDIIVIERTWLS